MTTDLDAVERRLTAALRDLADHVPEHAPPLQRVPQPVQPRRRTLTFVAAVTIVSVTCVTVFLFNREPHHRGKELHVTSPQTPAMGRSLGPLTRPTTPSTIPPNETRAQQTPPTPSTQAASTTARSSASTTPEGPTTTGASSADPVVVTVHPSPGNNEFEPAKGQRLQVTTPGPLNLLALGVQENEPPRSYGVVFGDPITTGKDPATSGKGVDIEYGFCGQPGEDTADRRTLTSQGRPEGIAWCDPTTLFHVIVRGPQQFLDDVSAHLQLAILP